MRLVSWSQIGFNIHKNFSLEFDSKIKIQSQPQIAASYKKNCLCNKGEYMKISIKSTSSPSEVVLRKRVLKIYTALLPNCNSNNVSKQLY